MVEFEQYYCLKNSKLQSSYMYIDNIVVEGYGYQQLECIKISWNISTRKINTG